MINRYTHGNLTWIDIESPEPEEVRSLIDEFNIDALVVEELLTPTLRPKVDYLEDYIYLILHFPALNKNTQTGDLEIDFIIGENFIITAHYDTVEPLHELAKLFEVESLLKQKSEEKHAGYLFFYMIRKLYRTTSNELSYLSETVKDIENRVFQGEERKMVYQISRVSKELLGFKRTLGNHRNVLKSFEAAADSLFDDFSYHAKAITGECYRVCHDIDVNAQIVAELRETNNSLVSTNQNEIMKILTIMAFVTFPLSLIAGIFGMNTMNNPIVGHPFDFWIIIVGMLTATALFFTFFKYKKWL